MISYDLDVERQEVQLFARLVLFDFYKKGMHVASCEQLATRNQNINRHGHTPWNMHLVSRWNKYSILPYLVDSELIQVLGKAGEYTDCIVTNSHHYLYLAVAFPHHLNSKTIKKTHITTLRYLLITVALHHLLYFSVLFVYHLRHFLQLMFLSVRVKNTTCKIVPAP